MKKLFFTVAIAITGFIASAQAIDKPITYSLGVHGALQTGDLSTVAGFGYGFSVQGEYRTISSFGLTGSIGFLNYAGKSVSVNVNGTTYTTNTSSTTQIPVLVGAKLYFGYKLFATGQVGLSFFNNGLGTAFTLAPGIGSRLGNGNFDLALRYLASPKSGNSLSALDLRLAYNF